MSKGCCDSYVGTMIGHMDATIDKNVLKLKNFSIFVTDPAPVELMCYTDAYNEVLVLQRLATAPQSVKDTQEEGKIFLDSSTKTAHHVEGNKPPDYLNLALHNTAANRQYELASLRELAKVLDYLKMNGNFALKQVQNR